MSGSISKAVNKAREKFESLVNEEELKAVVAAAVLVSAADGSISEE
jgi:tellurite resistance protein